MVARRLGGQSQSVSFSDFLDWGYSGFDAHVESTEHLEFVEQRVQRFLGRLGTSAQVRDLMGGLTHEVLMNAMYAAPVDAHGRPKYAADRTAKLVLSGDEQPHFQLASDGSRIVIQVTDRYGRLCRDHVVEGLSRGLQTGELDLSYGGAGLGITMCLRSAMAMFYDVVPGHRTAATAIFDLDANLREFRGAARSLHYFETQAPE